jgi:hypothetical protein
MQTDPTSRPVQPFIDFLIAPIEFFEFLRQFVIYLAIPGRRFESLCYFDEIGNITELQML